MLGTLIKGILGASLVMGVAFLSQSGVGESNTGAHDPLLKKGDGYSASLNDYFANASGWVKDGVDTTLSRFQTEAEKAGENIKTEAAADVAEVKEESVGSTKKFLAQKALQALGVKPEDLVEAEKLCK